MYTFLIQICMCVGEIILRQSPDVSLNEYVPLYLNKATPDDQVSIVVIIRAML